MPAEPLVDEPEPDPWYLAIPPETPEERQWRLDILNSDKPGMQPIEDLSDEERESFLTAIAELRSED